MVLLLSSSAIPPFGFAGCMPLSLTSFLPSLLLGSDLNVVL
jgi:hypothetical protein